VSIVRKIIFEMSLFSGIRVPWLVPRPSGRGALTGAFLIVFLLSSLGVGGLPAEAAERRFNWCCEDIVQLGTQQRVRFSLDEATRVLDEIERLVDGDDSARLRLVQLHENRKQSSNELIDRDAQIANLYDFLPKLDNSGPGYGQLGALVGKTRFGRESEFVVVQAIDPSKLGNDLVLRPGDEIRSVNGSSVSSPQEFVDAIRELSPGEAARLRVRVDDIWWERTIPIKKLTTLREGVQNYAIALDLGLIIEDLVRGAPIRVKLELLNRAIDLFPRAFHNPIDHDLDRRLRKQLLISLETLLSAIGRYVDDGHLEVDKRIVDLLVDSLYQAHRISMMDNFSAPENSYSLFYFGYQAAVQILALGRHDESNLHQAQLARLSDVLFDTANLAFVRSYEPKDDWLLSDAVQAASSVFVFSNLLQYSDGFPVSSPKRNLEIISWLHELPEVNLIKNIQFDKPQLEESDNEFVLARYRILLTFSNLRFTTYALHYDYDPKIAMAGLGLLEERVRLEKANPESIARAKANGWQTLDRDPGWQEELFLQWEVGFRLSESERLESVGNHLAWLSNQRRLVYLADQIYGPADETSVAAKKTLINSLINLGFPDEAYTVFQELLSITEPSSLIDRKLWWANATRNSVEYIKLSKEKWSFESEGFAQMAFDEIQRLYMHYIYLDIFAPEIRLLAPLIRRAILSAPQGVPAGELSAPRGEHNENERYKTFQLIMLDIAESVSAGDLKAIIRILNRMVALMGQTLEEVGLENQYFRDAPFLLAHALSMSGAHENVRALLESVIEIYEGQSDIFIGHKMIALALLADNNLRLGDEANALKRAEEAIALLEQHQSNVPIGWRPENILAVAGQAKAGALASLERLSAAVSYYKEELLPSFETLLAKRPAQRRAHERETSLTGQVGIYSSPLDSTEMLEINLLENLYTRFPSQLRSYNDVELREQVARLQEGLPIRSLPVATISNYSVGRYDEAIAYGEKTLHKAAEEYHSLPVASDTFRHQYAERIADSVFAYSASLIEVSNFETAFNTVDAFKSGLLTSSISLEQHQMSIGSGSTVYKRYRDLKHRLSVIRDTKIESEQETISSLADLSEEYSVIYDEI